MNTKLLQNVAFHTPLCIILYATFTYGEETISQNLRLLQVQIDQQKELVVGWENYANYEFAIAIIVIVLGGVVALLQKFDEKKWCSYVVAVIGIVISIFTWVSENFFEVNHKTYRKSAAIARIEISTVERLVEIMKDPDTNSQDRKELFILITKSMINIKSIARNLNETASVSAPHRMGSYFEFFRTAYAQGSPRPEWISQTKTEDSTSFRFVGHGTALSVVAAQSQALLDSQNTAALGLSVPLETVKQYAVLVDTYLEYNAEKKTYLCYAKVEINKAFVHR